MTTVHVWINTIGVSKDIGQLGELKKDNRIKIYIYHLPQALGETHKQ